MYNLVSAVFHSYGIKDFKEKYFSFFLIGLSLFYRPPRRYSLLSLIHNRSAGKHLVPEQFCLIRYGTGKVWGHLTTNYLTVYTFNQDQCILKGTFSLRSSFNSRPANTILISLGSTPCL